MQDLVRQEIAANCNTWVVKVGSRVLTFPDGRLNEERIGCFAGEVHELMQAGKRVVLVSSGAVASGLGRIGRKERPRDLAELQAVAAIGQCGLMECYDRSFRQHGRIVSQVLLTAEDLDDRTRYLNVRNTLLKLLEFGSVPIINENDTVSVAELQTTFGDNDRLAAMVTNLLRAPLLILLSDVDGLYDGDPKNPDSKLIHTVDKFEESLFHLVRDQASGVSKGGMASKLTAARIATLAGEHVIIANGRTKGVLSGILAGDLVGTLVMAQGQVITSWKRWLGFTAQPRGQLVLDPGARRAVESGGKSLLPIGVTEIIGNFNKGDLVALRDTLGAEFARGLTNYDSEEIRKIKGLKSDAIAAALGHCPYQELIHRDNLAITTIPAGN